eukprot:comp21377_c0_seq1/m.46096 comp21377_c0_seq1/g.46096  ORF comp21377_c0_seq1/g.46096 comp21377_c0_seq1/m.46096 type:complete len:300 (+) comp21377_c0_seq1:162-1061(+)
MILTGRWNTSARAVSSSFFSSFVSVMMSLSFGCTSVISSCSCTRFLAVATACCAYCCDCIVLLLIVCAKRSRYFGELLISSRCDTRDDWNVASASSMVAITLVSIEAPSRSENRPSAACLLPFPAVSWSRCLRKNCSSTRSLSSSARVAGFSANVSYAGALLGIAKGPLPAPAADDPGIAGLSALMSGMSMSPQSMSPVLIADADGTISKPQSISSAPAAAPVPALPAPAVVVGSSPKSMPPKSMPPESPKSISLALLLPADAAPAAAAGRWSTTDVGSGCPLQRRCTVPIVSLPCCST